MTARIISKVFGRDYITVRPIKIMIGSTNLFTTRNLYINHNIRPQLLTKSKTIRLLATETIQPKTKQPSFILGRLKESWKEYNDQNIIDKLLTLPGNTLYVICIVIFWIMTVILSVFFICCIFMAFGAAIIYLINM